MKRIKDLCVEEIAMYRKERMLKEQEESKLSDKAKRYSSYEVEGLPCVYGMDYLPLSDESKPTQLEQERRDLIWCFKNDCDDYSDKEYLKAKIRVHAFVKTVLRDCFSNDARKLTLLCIPSHSKEANDKRWKQFSRTICSELDMSNGTDYITYNQDADIPSHWGGSGYPDVAFDKRFFDGKTVVLLDDLVTSGQTISKTKQAIEDVGGRVIMAICIGRTKHRGL